jgi:hypothetical protein
MGKLSPLEDALGVSYCCDNLAQAVTARLRREFAVKANKMHIIVCTATGLCILMLYSLKYGLHKK